MRTNRAKLFAIIFFAVPVLLLTIFKETPARVGTFIADEPSVTYKTKCAACHTPKAEKFFDPAKADEEHVQIIMKGKKGAKPPFMPGYEDKGMTDVEAKAMVDFMKALKPAK
jgi:mono/diheme cytochrome c family protein